MSKIILTSHLTSISFSFGDKKFLKTDLQNKKYEEVGVGKTTELFEQVERHKSEHIVL